MLNLQDVINDKSLKVKQKTELLSTGLLSSQISVVELSAFAGAAKDPVKAICI